MGTFQSFSEVETDNSIIQTVDFDNDSVLSKQVEKFDNNYSDTKIKELTSQFDSITIDEDIINSVTTTEDDVIEKEKLSFRTKLFLVGSIAITSLLLFLAIFNIFSLNAMNHSIQLLESNIATETAIYNTLQTDVGNLNDTSDIMAELSANGYVEVSDADMIYVDVTNASLVEEVSASTNWFDSVCNFVSSIFGG